MTFGFIGYGSIAKKHIKAIATLYPGSFIILLRRSNEEISFESDNLKYTVTTDYKDLASVDYIFITNPTGMHAEVIRIVTVFMKPLFIEKPLASELNQISDLVEEINQSGVINYIACNMRFHSCINYLKKELLVKLRINEVNSYCGSYLPEWRVNCDFRKSYSANEKTGGGVHLDLIHELDYCFYLFGTPNKTHRALTSISSLEINAADYANYYWQYTTFSIQITLNYYRKDYKRTLEIVAEDATYLVDFKKCEIMRDNEIIFSEDPDANLMYQRQMKYFVDHANSRKKCFNDVNEAYQVLNLCLNES